jgi:hypothetical protein
MTRISVMQPYFVPYAGYFRLMCDVDVFVVLDVVQFPRGGWVHRNRLRRHDGAVDWFTLPLAHAPLGTKITDLRFRDAMAETMDRAVRRFPALSEPAEQTRALVREVRTSDGDPAAFLTRLLERTRDVLELRAPIVRASTLRWTPPPERVERILALCRHFNADAYVNAPGGRALYDPAVFRRCGIDLQFLPDYRGPHESILQRLHDSTASALRREILANLI